MAPPKAYQADSKLYKVGLEGFDLLNEYFKPPVRPPTHSTPSYDRQDHNINKFPRRFPASPPFDRRLHERSEHLYGGFQEDYISRGPRVWYGGAVIDCNEAAKLYGGVVIVDHVIRNPN